MKPENAHNLAHSHSNIGHFGFATPPHFSSRVLAKWDYAAFLKLKQYVVVEDKNSTNSINVFNVIGTTHPDHAGKTWLELLEDPHCSESTIPMLQKNPGYYLCAARKIPEMQFISLDGGDLYIEEGNHRTAVAMFLLPTKGLTQLHGVSLQDYRIDWHFKELCDQMTAKLRHLKMPVSFEVCRELVERRDVADWRQDRYSLTVKLHNHKTGDTFWLDSEKLAGFIDMLELPWWRRAFLKG